MKLPYVLLSGSWYVINKGIATIKEQMCMIVYIYEANYKSRATTIVIFLVL